jgi:hypothetical protein
LFPIPLVKPGKRFVRPGKFVLKRLVKPGSTGLTRLVIAG